MNMMIIGAEIKRSSTKNGDGGIVEVILVPLTTIKVKQPGFMDLLGGNMETLMQQAQSLEQYKTRHYISIGEWQDKKYHISSHVTLDMYPEEEV